MEAEEVVPLFQQIITKTKFEDNVDEITFPAPVCLTGIAVGAMPGSVPDGGHAFLNVFARDTRACGSARFACLYEGLQQPAAGVAAVHIQPFVTDHVLLRGQYQTAPITLLGVALAEAAAQYIPRPETPVIALEEALPRFQGIVESLPEEQNAASTTAMTKISFLKDAWPALENLLKFWRQVGSSYRKISQCTVPAAVFTAAIKAADAICEKLASIDDGGGNIIFDDDDDELKSLSIDDSELIDMAMGWSGLLAEIPIPLAASTSVSECSTAGIAAMVLLSTRSSAATALLARHGQLLIADVLKASPMAPGSQLRHATGACLLLALTNGGAGCEALLGWWSPSFVQWAAPPAVKKIHVEEEKHHHRHQRDHHREERRDKVVGSEASGKGEKPRKIIPQVDGAGDEKRGWNSSKRKKRDGSNNRGDEHQQHHRGHANARNSDDKWQQNRGGGRSYRGGNSHGGSVGGQHHRQFINDDNIDDDRWDGGDGGSVDDFLGGDWEPEYIEEEGDRRRKERDHGDGDRKERNRRIKGKEQQQEEEEKKKESHRHHRHGSSKDRDRSRERSRGGYGRESEKRGRDRDRDAPRSGRDKQQKEQIKEKRPRRDDSPPPAAAAAAVEEKRGRREEKQPDRGGRIRKGEEPEKKKEDLRQQHRAPLRAPVSRPSPPAAAADRGGRGTIARSPPAPPPPSPPAAGKGGKGEPEDVAILHKFTLYWDNRLRHYVGIYSSLATILMQIQPRTVTTLGTRLMRVLRFYEHATIFSNIAEELTNQYLPSKRSSMPSQEGAALAGKCGAALASMGEYLAIGDFVSSSKRTSILNPLLIELMASRRVLHFLPALVLVPAAHKARSEEEGGDAASTAAASSAAMSNQLALGLRTFLSALTSSTPALDIALASAIAPLAHLIVAVAAVEDLCTCSFTSSTFSSAATTLGQLLSGGPSHRIPAVHAVCLDATRALPKLGDAVIQRCNVLLEAAGIRVPVEETKEEKEFDGDAFGKVLDSLPSLEICTDILLAVLKECTSINVVSLLAPTAAALLSLLPVATQGLCGCPVPGAAVVFTAVESMCGGFEALSTFNSTANSSESTSTSAAQSLLTMLSSDLPPLAALSHENFLSSSSSTCIDIEEDTNGGSSSIYVDWADIREFWDNPRRKYRTEMALKLLTMLLWQPTSGEIDATNGSSALNTNAKCVSSGRSAADEMQYHDGQRLVLRALVTAGETTAASNADRQWVSRAGAAIDPASAASNKQAALEFLSSAAALASAFFQHMRDAVPVSSTACATALLEAHAMVSSEEDCLLALMGQANAAACGAAALTARHHLTSALRCWMESSSSTSTSETPWAPTLLPLILFGSKHAKRCTQHAVPALPPRQIFTAACILGDLSPAEWPPPGTRRHVNPLPSFRAYRTAFAKAIENNVGPFNSLISACVEAEPTLLRAAAARMLARAAGFGGGMGEFILRPIVAALESGAASQTPAHDVRKVLELLVPLVYRPALKAALLDTTGPVTLAHILRVMVTGLPLGATPGMTPPPTIDPSDASAICTMTLECLVVLCSPEHMLDPQTPPEVAAVEDTPNVNQGAIIASTLFEILSSLGVNVPLAHRVLRLLAGTVPGRNSLRRAAAALHAMATQKMDPGPNPAMSDIVAAAQWVATRYWGLSQQAQHEGSNSSNSETYADVSNIMKEICLTMEADAMVAQQDHKPASVRFAAATKSSIAAAIAAGVDLRAAEHRWVKGVPDPISTTSANITENSTRTGTTAAGVAAAAAAAASDLAVASGVFDPVTRMFWKNYRARAVQQTSASAAMVLRKYIRRACLPDEYFTVADTLHLPLTRPVRPLREDMEAGQEGDDEAGDAAMEKVGIPPQLGNGEEVKEGEGALMMEEAAIKMEEIKVEKEGDVPSLPVLPQGASVVAAPTLLPSAVPVIAPSSAPAADFDLYADLGADLGIGEGEGEGEVAVAPGAVPAPKAAPKPKPAPISEPRSSHLSDDPAALLNDPEAIAALLQDPVKMQELLQRNPALLVALKSKLGKSSRDGGGTQK
ncbi:hypothetical protein Ndes2526B_g01224 [Nannochloris sp. 'desiccata']